MAQQADPSEDIVSRVMRLLQAYPDLTQRELGVSVGGLNYCLRALIDKGRVKMQIFSQSKKNRLRLHPHPDRHGRKSCSHQPLPQAQDERIRDVEVEDRSA